MSACQRKMRKLGRFSVLSVLNLCLLVSTKGLVGSALGSDPAATVPSGPAKNTSNAFRITPGFRLELVAAEPAVTAPVAMAFDEDGRLLVLERPESPSFGSTNTPVGRIRLLEDPDEEGEFHTSTVCADNLPWASALACYSAGVFVAAGPNLVFLRSTRINSSSNVQDVVFSGFAMTNQANELALVNNFHWGLDNRIHAASGGTVGMVPLCGAPGAPLVSLTRADLSFDPRGLNMCAEAGPAQSGLSFDNWGRKFTCDYARPLRTPAYQPRYLARNPFFPPPSPLLDVASPATSIFRLGTGVPPGSNEAPAGANTEITASARMPIATWLTNAQGCAVYRGNAFPSNFLGNVFIADASAHVVHRVVVQGAGLSWSSSRGASEPKSEFLAAADAGFRPVQIANGPDGALYIVDRRDADDRGRIYRIVPTDFQRPKPPRLGKASTYDLVATLSHPNGWHRDTAARLLYERRDPKAIPLLASLLTSSRAPWARLHALHALEGLGALKSTQVLAGLRDADERIREHAVLLAEKLAPGGVLPDAVWSQLRLLSADPSPRVRYQLAFTVGEFRRPDRTQVLAALLRRDATNLWMQAAVFSSVSEGAGDLFLALAGDARVRQDPIGQDWLLRLAAMIGVRGLAAEVAQVTGFIEELRNSPQAAFALLYALGDGLHRTRSSLALVDRGGQLQSLYVQALNGVGNYLLPDALRIGAFQVLGVGPYNFDNAGDLTLLPLGSGQSLAVQTAALAALGRFRDPRIAPAVVQRWQTFSPALRREAVTALLARSERIEAVLNALEEGRISRTDFTSAQMNLLRTHPDTAMSQRALRLFGPVPASDRKPYNAIALHSA